ncbi:MAG: YabP/YqfC family sporulation protein [Oscillospiraceae bacterium]|nr:YabP/YqfC family sporulation protein [Oscillospiraceae bacterium]
MKWLQKQRIALSEEADLPLRIAGGLPQIALDGFERVSVDLQRGLLSYSDTQVEIAVPAGTVCVCGSDLRIRLMKENRIVLSGAITELHLRREERP